MEGGTRGKKLWIKNAVRHKGLLHEELGIPEGEKIPPRKLTKAAKSKNPKIRREAILAETLEKLHKKPKKKTVATKKKTAVKKTAAAKKKPTVKKKVTKTVKKPTKAKKVTKTKKKKTTKAKKK